jgi:amino acid adenylation domain-containing protein
MANQDSGPPKNPPPHELIALVGIGLRLPEANTPSAFWHQLTEGYCSVKKIQQARPELALSLEKESVIAQSYGSFLNDIDQFDAGFFNISASEAQAMDPQQRLLMEVTYEALQDAKIKAAATKGKNIAVMVGISNVDYSHYAFKDTNQIDAYTLTGVSPSICSNRLSYHFDWHGPSLTIDTACSSSLVALHLARKSLLAGEADAAVVAAANLILTPFVTMGYANATALSPQGKCRAFDADADGVVRGEGVAAVYLKRLSDAIADGDTIYCVLRGSGIAQDGQTNGLTAPSPTGQKRAIEAALTAAHVNAEEVDYIETHGTGTLLGDPIEAKALADIYGRNRTKEQFLKIGSVKTNIGHLEAAAGLAGFIKTALCIHHQQLVPSLHFDRPNPYIPFQTYKMTVQTTQQKWEGAKRIAGVSSFGFGGTNAHIIVENFVAKKKAPKTASFPRQQYILPLSADSATSLSHMLKEWEQLLPLTPSHNWPQLIATLIQSRDTFNYRCAPIFEAVIDIPMAFKNNVMQRKPARTRPIAFIFSGMGSQSLAMGKALRTIPIFRQTILHCDELLKSYIAWSTWDLIQGNSTLSIEDNAEAAQLAIFSIQIALFETLKTLGVVPTAVIGSSMGEVAAAYAAGCLTLEMAVQVVVTRIQLLTTQINTGSMAVAALSPTEAQNIAANIPNLWVVAHNSPSQVVFAGKPKAIEFLLSHLKKQKITAKPLKGGSAPSHTPLMNIIKPDFFKLLEGLKAKSAGVAFYSTVTGARLTEGTVDSNYWWTNISGPIHYLEAINEMEKDLKPIFIEISPHPVLLTNTIEIIQAHRPQLDALPCMKRTDEDEYTFLATLNQLYQLGININWSLFYPDNRVTNINLPLYPWDHHSYWKGTKATKWENNNLTAPFNTEHPGSQTTEYVLRQQLLSMPSELDQLTFVGNYLRTNLAHALKIDENDIVMERSLKDLNVGSLIGMDLYNRLKNDFAITMPIAFFLSGPSLKNIAQEVIIKAKETPAAEKITRQLSTTEAHISFGQMRLLFLTKLVPDPTVYHIPIVVELIGELNVQALHQAFTDLTARHDILRTIYQEQEGQFRAQVLPQLDYEFLHDRAEFSTENEKLLALKAAACRPFSSPHQAYFRVFLVEEQENRFTLLLTIHHLIIDGWGLKVLLNDLMAFYLNHINLPTSLPPPLAFQFSDYALWQKNQWEEGAWNNQQIYWQEKLKNCPVESSFALDYERQALQSFHGQRDIFIISPSEKKTLEHFCNSQSITPFMLLTAIINILIYRNTGSSDTVIGTPIAGRQEPGTEQLVGCLLNMIPLRTQMDQGTTVYSLLEQIRNEVLNAFSHQDIPLEKIIEVAELPHLLSHTPIFQVVIAFHAPVPLQKFANLSAQLIDLDLKTAKFDVSFSFIEKEDYLEGIIEYNTELFAAASVTNWLCAFKSILHTLVNNADLAIDSIPLLDEMTLQTRNHQLEKELQHKQSSYHHPSLVPQLVNFNILEQADALAISDTQHQLSYKMLNQLAEQFAQQLLLAHIQPQNTVALILPAGAPLIAAQWGTWKLNAVFVTIDPNLPPKHIEKILATAKIDIICYDEHFEDLLHLFAGPTIKWEQVIHSPSTQTLKTYPILGDDLAYLILTSGTTGVPKVIEISHTAFAHLINWHLETYCNDSTSQCSQLAGIGFDASLWEIWAALSGGSTLHIPNSATKQNLQALHHWIHSQHITHCFLSTPLFEACNDFDWAESHLKWVLTGGDRLRLWPSSKWPCPVINHYGPAECAVVTSAMPLNEYQQKQFPPIGKAIGYNTILLLDKNKNPVPPGFIGELHITGPSIGRGYRPPQAIPSTSSFIANPYGLTPLYQSGDLARETTEGDFLFMGRRDQQVKISGVRIELTEIEQAIHALDYIQHAELLAVEHPTIGTQLCCYVNVKEHCTMTESNIPAAIAAQIKNQLGVYKVPAHIKVLSHMPLTANGKIDRKNLAARSVSPTPNPIIVHDLETQDLATFTHSLVQLLRDLLKTDQINKNSDFFAYGGNSILAMQFVALIQQKLHIELSIKELFKNSNLTTLAPVLYNRSLQEQQPPLLPNPQDQFEKFPLTDIQQAYWIGRRTDIEGGGIASQIYVEIDSPQLDVARLEQAWNQLIARHAMLRTVLTDDGQQYCLAEIPYYSILINDSQKALENIRQQNSHRYFEPTQWPLFAVSVSSTLKEHRIHFNIDGLIADAHSLKIILNELWDLYQGKNLTPLELSFRDYQLYAQTHFGPKDKSKDYWRQQLPHIPQAPQLPIRQEKANDILFLRNTKILPSIHWEAIKQKAGRERISPSTVLLTAFSIVLARWSENQFFTLMLTIFNRKNIHPEINNIIGDFTTILPLSINLTHFKSLLNTSHTIQSTILNHLDHSDIGGIWILRELQKMGASAAQTHFPVVFTSFLGEDFDTKNTPFGTLVYNLTQTPQVWIDHQVCENKGELHFNWDYNSSVLSEAVVNPMFDAYCHVLELLATDSSLWERSDLDVWADLNNQVATHYQTLPALSHSFSDLYALFERGLHLSAHNAALITPQITLSYSELAELINKGRSILKKYGVKPNDGVALNLPKSWQQIVAVLAILAEGAFFVPIATQQPPHRVAYILDKSNAKMMLHANNYQEKNSTIASINWLEELSHIQATTEPRINNSPEALAYIIFTSGSTGTPKGVQMQHQAVIPTLLAVNNIVQLTATDRTFYLSDLSFDLAIYDIFAAFAVSSTVVIPESIPTHEIDRLADFAQTAKVTIWNSVPTLFKMYFELAANRHQYIIPTLRCVLQSGDWISLELSKRVIEQFPTLKLYSLGGATEAAIWSIYYPIEAVLSTWQSIPYGYPLPGQQVHVYNEKMQPCPPLVPGTLYISGVGLSLGYANEPELTLKKFVTHQGVRLYETGDRGRYLPNYAIEFLGRLDQQVKIQGYRIELTEIEHQLKTIPEIKEAIVTAWGQLKEEKTLVAYIEPYHPTALTDLNVSDVLARKLPIYMLPRRYVLQSDWPLNSNGKIDRQKLPSPFTETTINVNSTHSAHVHIDEMKQIIITTLKLESISDNDEFLALGANSVDLVLISNQLQERYGFAPGISEIFRLKNLSLLSEWYTNKLSNPSAQEPIKSPILIGKSRDEFKSQKRWLRTIIGDPISLKSDASINDIAVKSSRTFTNEPLQKSQLSALLSSLNQNLNEEAEYKAQYPSAGSLFPVQTYLMVKKGRVIGIPEGLYYYHPVEQHLIQLSDHNPTANEIHLAMNSAIAQESCCSLYLFNYLDAIEPLYADASLEYGLIEAGAMTQLLRMNAPALNIGLCSIGQINSEPIKKRAGLDARYQFLHALEIGTIAPNEPQAWEELTF